VLGARAKKNDTVRRAILLGYWDGGLYLERFGLPKKFEDDWKNRPCEALEKEGG
jgi:hypothetical protein